MQDKVPQADRISVPSLCRGQNYSVDHGRGVYMRIIYIGLKPHEKFEDHSYRPQSRGRRQHLRGKNGEESKMKLLTIERTYV